MDSVTTSAGLPWGRSDQPHDGCDLGLAEAAKLIRLIALVAGTLAEKKRWVYDEHLERWKDARTWNSWKEILYVVGTSRGCSY